MAAGTASPAADGATAVAASTTGAGMAAGMDARASVATNDAHASGASGADADMVAGMATDVTTDGPDITLCGAADGTMTVHQSADNTVTGHQGRAGNPRQRNRKRSRPHSARAHSRMAAYTISAHEGSSASMLDGGLSDGDGTAP